MRRVASMLVGVSMVVSAFASSGARAGDICNEINIFTWVGGAVAYATNTFGCVRKSVKEVSTTIVLTDSTSSGEITIQPYVSASNTCNNNTPPGTHPRTKKTKKDPAGKVEFFDGNSKLVKTIKIYAWGKDTSGRFIGGPEVSIPDIASSGRITAMVKLAADCKWVERRVNFSILA